MSLINREIPFFKHYADLSQRPEIKLIRAKHGLDGYGVYLMLLERLAMTQDGEEQVDFAVLAYDFRSTEEVVRSILCDFGLFKINVNDNVVKYSSKYLDEQASE